MTRRVFYRNSEPTDFFLAVHVTRSMNASLERAAEEMGRTKADFIRMALAEGLKALTGTGSRDRHFPDPRSIGTRHGSKSTGDADGFMLAPLLYVLALGGIGAAVMFSGYSQVLRSNAEMTAINTARQQLNAAGQTLSASSVLDAATSTIVQPPAAFPYGSVSDTNRLPGGYAAVNSSGTPTSYGVIDVSAGVRQIDPWGKYYIYCSWENLVSTPASPSIMVISGGPDGIIQTKCGDASAQGDDRINRLTVAEAINRANVWQVNSASQVKFGIASNAVKVNDDGTMQAASLTLATPLAISSGGTGAATAALARTNLAVPDYIGTGATGTWGISISGNAATATLLQTTRNFSIIGSTGLTAAAIGFNGSADVALSLTGTLALASGGTGATTAAGARGNLGSTSVGDALFTAASAAAARSTLGLGTMATQDANNVAITGGTISAVIAAQNGSSIPASAITAAGSNGQVQFNSSNTLGADSALTWDNTNKRLGIGASTPTSKLHVQINADATTPQPVLTIGNAYAGQNVDYLFKLDATKKLHLLGGSGGSAFYFDNNAGVNQFFVTAGGNGFFAGNVGIGTTAPSYHVDIYGNGISGNARATALFLAKSAGTYGSVSINSGNASVSGFIDWRNPAADGANGTRLAYMGYDSTNLALVLENGANFTIATASTGGKVGIGTTSPTALLDVAGTANANNWQLVGSTAGNAGTVGFLNANGPAIQMWGTGTAQTGRMFLQTAGSIRLTIDNSGNVGIGTTAPGYPFHVLGNVLNSYVAGFVNSNTHGALGQGTNYGLVGYATSSGGNGVFGQNTSTTAYGQLGYGATGAHGVAGSASGHGVHGEGAASGSTSYGVIGTAGSYYGALGRADGYSFVGNGTLYNNGDAYATNYYHLSDRRMKDNIKTVPGLAIIDKLTGVTFTWKKDGKASAGVIAQDTEAVFPAAVVTTDKGMKLVSYDTLIAPLIEAVKDLKRDADEQRSTLAALRRDFDAYKTAHP